MITRTAISTVALKNGLATAVTTCGSGTAYALGPVSSCQALYGYLHVTQLAGRMTVTIESATSSGFTAPTTRGTFADSTAVGAKVLTPVSGPITDVFFRSAWVVSSSAGTPSNKMLSLMGIE